MHKTDGLVLHLVLSILTKKCSDAAIDDATGIIGYQDWYQSWHMTKKVAPLFISVVFS